MIVLRRTFLKVLFAATFAATVAYAQLPGTLTLLPSGGAGAISVTNVANESSAAGAGNPKTISSVSFGAAASTRSLLITVEGQRGASGLTDITAVTVGGETPTELVSPLALGSSVTGVLGVYAIDAGTGDALEGVTSGDIAITGDNVATWRVSVFRLLDANVSAAVATPQTDNTDDPSVTLPTIPAGGAAFAVAMSYKSGSSSGAAWTGLTEADENVVDSNVLYTSAFDAFASAESSYGVSVDFTQTSPDFAGMIALAIAPN